MDKHTQMQAVVCHGPKDYRLERISKPQARPNELVIRIAACGICASDCKCHSGAAMFWGGDNPWVKAPVVPGHEFLAMWSKWARAPRSTSRSRWATR